MWLPIFSIKVAVYEVNSSKARSFSSRVHKTLLGDRLTEMKALVTVLLSTLLSICMAAPAMDNAKVQMFSVI